MAKFQKGNPGKPKGAKSRSTTRAELGKWIDDNFARFQQEMQRVKGARFCELYIKSLEFVMPRYASVAMSLNQMSEQDLEFLINHIRNTMGNESDTDL